MENESRTPTKNEAADSLALLGADRERLAGQVDTPWSLLAGFGGVAAFFVALAASTSPGADYEPPTAGWLGLVAALVIAHLLRRETGVRFRGMGVAAGAALVAIVLGCLVLYSVSLGLVSFGLGWTVILTSVAAFALTTGLAGVAHRSAVERLRAAR